MNKKFFCIKKNGINLGIIFTRREARQYIKNDKKYDSNIYADYKIIRIK